MDGDMMHDASGNILSKAYEYSIEGTAITAADRISKAIWKLTHAQAKRRTKREIQKDIEEATKMLMDAMELINGRRT